MTGEEYEFSINNGDFIDWQNNTTCFTDKIMVNERKSTENLKISTVMKGNQPKFKTAVQNVIKKIKLMTKGVFVDDELPDPNEMPIDMMEVMHFNSNLVLEDSHFSSSNQDFLNPENCLTTTLSNKGFCILYEDNKTNYHQVVDISNESSCSGFFEWFSCYNLMPKSAQIKVFDINLQIVKAFHFLIQSNSRAAPIWDSDKNEFIAMLTITDLIKFLHKYYVIDTMKLENLKHNTIKDFLEVLKEHRTKFIHISPECNLKYAILTIRKNNIHRLPVVDPLNGNILCIITNSQLFRFFYSKYKSQLNSLTFMSKSPTDLGLGIFDGSIATIHPWESIYKAFDIFIHNQISVLPVVDENNKLIDIYARYDVVELAESNNYKNLNCTIADILKTRKLMRTPCICKREYSLQKIMEIIFEAQSVTSYLRFIECSLWTMITVFWELYLFQIFWHFYVPLDIKHYIYCTFHCNHNLLFYMFILCKT